MNTLNIIRKCENKCTHLVIIKFVNIIRNYKKKNKHTHLILRNTLNILNIIRNCENKYTHLIITNTLNVIIAKINI